MVDKKIIYEFNPYNPENELIIEVEEGYFIVNTNVTWSQTNYKDMLNQKKASGYYERKYGISYIKKGDTVFLYHTGVGIVAYGKTSGTYKMADVNGDKDGEYYVELEFEWKIDPDTEPDQAVKAWEINEKLKSGHRFRQTVFSISREMADTIKELSKT